MIQKKASELQQGDVVHLADLVDTVIRVVHDTSGATVDVLVSRNGGLLWWCAGADSMQDVEVPE